MASHGSGNFRTFNSNFSPNNYNGNSGMDRHRGTQLQKPFNVPFRPLQPSQTFMHGFHNRPQFSNFPESVNGNDFLNRPPPPLPPPSLPLPSGSFPPPHNMPPFSPSPHQPPTHHTPRHQHPTHHAPPHQHPLPPHHTIPFQQPPPANHAPSISQPPPHSRFSVPPRPLASHSYHRPPAPLSHAPVSHHSRSSLPSTSHHPHPHSPIRPHQPVTPPHQAFPMNSPPPLPRPRFSSSVQRPFRHWNQMSRFGNSRPPFQNQVRMPVPSSQFQDKSLRTDKKKKQRSRDSRKLKDNTTEKPFSCDTCDRAFVTEKELEGHFSQHIKCNHENCSFEAHPKIIELHKKMQHDTGYADRISRLKDSAEIKKWREERRRRFPTAENIKKRKAEQAEREARGEVLETKEFGKFKRRKEENRNGNVDNNFKRKPKRRPRKFQDRRAVQGHHSSQPFKVDSESDSDSDSHITLNAFLGLSSLTNSVTEESGQNNDVEVFSTPCISTDADSEKQQLISQSSSKQNLPKFNSVNVNHLDVSYSENNSVNGNVDTPFLLNAEKINVHTTCADQSVCEIPECEVEKPPSEVVIIEDSDNEGPEVFPIVISRERADINGRYMNNGAVKTFSAISEVPNTFEVDNKKDTRNGGVNTSSSISEVPKICEVDNKKDTQNDKKPGNPFTRRNNNKVPDKQYATDEVRKSSLLEKLLAGDIRHERNVILQCIRHIVNNNFFGIAAKKS